MITIKRYYTIIISVLLLTDLTIFLNIPILRQVLGFLCFTIIPGILILHILKLNKIEFLKKFVLSVGLSIAFLMFIGFFLNQLYLAVGISKPLSTFSLIISFTFILVILAFIAYKRNKDDFDISDVFNVKLNIKKDQFTTPLLFPIIFPFLAVFGTYLMNTEGNNIILMVMLFLIPIYVIFVVYLRNRIPTITYPVATLTIGVALVLMHGLTSNYLNGRDVHNEYYAFRVVADNLYWSMSNYHHALTACLSTSLLPTVYWSLMGINKLYIYKVVYQLIWATTPLVCYTLSKKYIGEMYAFLASVLIMSQTVFIYGMQSAMRTELALFFFVLSMMVFFDDEVDKLNKKVLFIIFVFAVIVSHYSTSYIFFFLLLFLFLITMAFKDWFKSDKKVTAIIITLFFAVIFLWYSQLTETAFTSGVSFIKNTFTTLGDLFVEESRYQDAYTVFGKTVTGPIKLISVIVFDTVIAFIIIGILSSLIDKRSNLEKEYTLTLLISYGLVASYILLPFVSMGYGSQRTYMQGLVLFAPAFVIGGKTICRIIRQPHFSLLIIMIVLISQFFCGSYLLHKIGGIPHSEDLNREGGSYGEYYIHDQGVIGARWLYEHGAYNSRIYTDYAGYSRLKLGYGVGEQPSVRGDFFAKNETIDKGYIYLRYLNVVDGIVHPTVEHADAKPIAEYLHLFVGKRKIYDNGGSEVWT